MERKRRAGAERERAFQNCAQVTSREGPSTIRTKTSEKMHVRFRAKSRGPGLRARVANSRADYNVRRGSRAVNKYTRGSDRERRRERNIEREKAVKKEQRKIGIQVERRLRIRRKGCRGD